MAGENKDARARPGGSREPADRERSNLTFHYSRDDRLAMTGAPKTSPPQGFFRRYRGMLIILADISILMILGLLALRFLGPPASSARVGAYSASLRGLGYGEVVFATVTLRCVTAGAAGEEGRVFVRFAVARSAAEAESLFDSAPLPTVKGDEVVLRAALPLDDSVERIYAEVQAGEDSARLSMPRSAW